MSYSSSLAATPVHAVAAPVLAVVDGVVTTTSLAVAEYFVKPHDDVLKKIRTVFADCPSEFTAGNFAASEYTDATGRTLPSYRITRKGFTFLAMGFTGKRANVFKIAYIDEFDRMEADLLAQADRPARTGPAQMLLTMTADGMVDSIFYLKDYHNVVDTRNPKAIDMLLAEILPDYLLLPAIHTLTARLADLAMTPIAPNVALGGL